MTGPGLIRQQIAEGLEHEAKTHRLRMLIRMRWIAMAVTPGEIEARVESTFQFVKTYIESAPDMIEAVVQAADEPASGVVARAVSAAEDYFHETVDFIPDHLGLIGLVDDAYLTHCLLQALSNSHRDRTGEALLPVDSEPANRAIRAMIGEPVASQLDAAIDGVIRMGSVQSAIDTLSELGRLSVEVDDPFRDSPAVRDRLEIGLGALG